MNEWLKLVADVLYSKLEGVGKMPIAAIPAAHVGGATALAVTVIGVGTELPFAGLLTVIMPFEVEARAMTTDSRMKRTSPIFKVTPHPSHFGQSCVEYTPLEWSAVLQIQMGAGLSPACRLGWG